MILIDLKDVKALFNKESVTIVDVVRFGLSLFKLQKVHPELFKTVL